MPQYVFTAQGSNNLSTLTLGEAKSMAAEAVGAQGMASKVQAATAMKRARRWLLRENWHYLSVKGTGIVIPASATEVDLPMPLRNIITVKVGTATADRELTFVPLNQANTALQEGNSLGGTYHYTYEGWQRTGKIRLLDPWAASPGVMDIWAMRPIAEPLSDTETLDLLEGPMELAYIDMASVYIATMAGAKSEVIDRLQRLASSHYRQARGMDKDVYGAVFGFLPHKVWSQSHNTLRRGPRRSSFYGGY